MTTERSLAELAAERLIKERNLRIPVDPFAIAEGERIAVFPKDATGGVSGMFMRVGDDFAIAYASHLENIGFQRFSVAHELGHYFLPGHVEHVLEGGKVHESRAGFTSKLPHEVEADQFAAGLLLPANQFRMLASRYEPGLSAIENLATDCCTSLTATAIRLTQYSTESVAIVVSNQDNVEFCFMSSEFHTLRGAVWPQRGEPIPRRTATYAFVGDPNAIVRAERTENSVHLHDWFGGGPDLRLCEEVIGLGRYGRVLTILTPESHIDEEDIEEEAALLESWTPEFSRRKR